MYNGFGMLNVLESRMRLASLSLELTMIVLKWPAWNIRQTGGLDEHEHLSFCPDNVSVRI